MTEKSLYQRWNVRLTAFEELTGKWRDIGLAAIQRSPDASQLVSLREAVVQGRRHLASRTKEFAKYSSEEKVAEMGGLIKLYQEHIDAVTKCEAFAEKAFSELHTAVAKMVDPYPMMDKFSREKQTILGFVKAQDECDSLRRTVAEYENELQGLKNQEVTIERLREQVAAAELAVASKLEQSASDASAELHTVLRQWQERESAMQRELTDASALVAKVQADNKALDAQTAASRQRLDELSVQRETEVDELVTELDGCHTKISLLEKALVAAATQQQQQALAATTTTSDQGDATPARSLQPLVQPATVLDEDAIERLRHAAVESAVSQLRAAHHVELQQLRADVLRLEDQLAESERRLSTSNDEASRLVQATRSLSQEVLSKSEHVSALEAECQSLRESIRRTEGELRRQPATVSVQENLDIPPPFSSSAEGPIVVATADLLSASSADFLAVAAQRDSLRQRLLSLEEASSSQIHALTVEVHRLQDECGKLRGLVRLHQTSAGGGGVLVRGEDEEVDHRSLSELSRTSGKGAATREATIRFLDATMTVLYKHVLTNLQLRRLFLGYLVVLHFLMFLNVLRRVLF